MDTGAGALHELPAELNAADVAGAQHGLAVPEVQPWQRAMGIAMPLRAELPHMGWIERHGRWRLLRRTGFAIQAMNPIEFLIRKADLQCTVCKSPASKGCTCWEKCSCGWSALRGFQCGNRETRKCSTKVKYDRQCTTEEYWHATETGEIKRLHETAVVERKVRYSRKQLYQRTRKPK